MIFDRFNHDADTIPDAKEYMFNRAKQLLYFGYFLDNIYEYSFGVIAIFVHGRSKIAYKSIFLLKSHRGKGKFPSICKEYMPLSDILTSRDCNIETYLSKKNIKYISVDHQLDEYKIISEYYGSKKANRSGVYLMNHIDEGIYILNQIGASETAIRAYCLHPIIQSDDDLFKNWNKDSIFKKVSDYKVLSCLYEYRNIANNFLTTNMQNNVLKLSPIKDVNDMLIADKIQNKKDFDLYHKHSHNNSENLTKYFNMWLEKLSISNQKYNELTSKII